MKSANHSDPSSLRPPRSDPLAATLSPVQSPRPPRRNPPAASGAVRARGHPVTGFSMETSTLDQSSVSSEKAQSATLRGSTQQIGSDPVGQTSAKCQGIGMLGSVLWVGVRQGEVAG